jgi:hypothetical protein
MSMPQSFMQTVNGIYNMWKIFGLLAFALFVMIIIPIAAIGSLNTLFNLDIPVNLSTWSSVVVLSMVINGSGVSFKK